MFRRNKTNGIFNILVVIFLFVLPYYLFDGKLFLGGDDTRLLYVFPFDFLKNVSFFSWHNVSSVGMNVPNQYSIPFLIVWTLFDKILNNKVILDYFSFSLPLVLGFIYFQKFIKEIFSFSKKNEIEIFVGSLLFTLSPILIINQLFIFLTVIWLLAVIPILGYYYLKFIKTPKFIYIYKCLISSVLFAFAFLSVPWILGLILPLSIGGLFLVFLTTKKEIMIFVKRSILFFVPLLLSQSFWVIGFFSTYFSLDKSSYASKFVSQDFLSTFALTVSGTAVGNVFYPLLNLFHRSIAFNFDWKLMNDFINLYDRAIFLNVFYILVIFGGIVLFKKRLGRKDRRIYIFLLISFIFSLYFFTVNIGPLKDLFYQLGKIPGFIMFRNFYDKFALGYVFIYSIIFTAGLILIKKKYPSKILFFNAALIVLILLNFSASKSTINSPLWTTDNIYKTINIPDEYLKFMDYIKVNISSTNNILSVPVGVASYTTIKDINTNNVYFGVSPVKIFSGVNDISGNQSFNLTADGDLLNQLIIKRNYKEFNNLLFRHNINYVLLTKNLPEGVLNSYGYSQKSVSKQDTEFVKSITNGLLFKSKNGNYELFRTKKQNILIEGKNVTFRKINSVKYEIYIKNLSGNEKITFNDTYHSGWRLFTDQNPSGIYCSNKIILNSKECPQKFSFFDPKELLYAFVKPVFADSHSTVDGQENSWILNSNAVKNLDKKYYSTNKDGSVNIELTLYFVPQLYFYYGSIITILVILVSTIYLFYTHKNGN